MSESAQRRADAMDFALDVALRLTLVAILVGMCLTVMRPFAVLLLWSLILAVALSAPFEKLAQILGKRGRAATVLSLLSAALLLVPTYFLGSSLFETVTGLRTSLEAGTLQAPEANEALLNVPVIGGQLYGAWDLAHDDLQQAVEQFEPQLRSGVLWTIDFLRGVAGDLLVTVIALVLATVLLAYRDNAVSGATVIAQRLAPEGGEEYVNMVGATINSVLQGVIGIAAIQAFLTLVLLLLVGMPFAGLLAVVMFVIATLQIPGIVVMIMPILWSFSHLTGLGLILFIVACLGVGVADTALKPLLLGRGLPVPTLVILIGAIGGMISLGLIGLFVGAVLLCLGYRLMLRWLGVEDTVEPDTAPPASEAAPA